VAGRTTIALRPCKATPLTSSSAPVVVLVVATRVPDVPSNGLKLANFAEGGRVAMLVRAMKVERRTVVQGRAAGKNLHGAGIRKLADDYPFGAAERSCEPAGRERNTASVGVAERLERGGVGRLAWRGRMHAGVAGGVDAPVYRHQQRKGEHLHLGRDPGPWRGDDAVAAGRKIHKAGGKAYARPVAGMTAGKFVQPCRNALNKWRNK
jgi:hypothetical protein